LVKTVEKNNQGALEYSQGREVATESSILPGIEKGFCEKDDGEN
jgi:hypothetical protein